MVNLPDRYSDRKIFGIPIDSGFKIVSKGTEEDSASTYIIVDIRAATDQGLASAIADAIRDARNIGFEQGRAYVRKALGLKE